MARPKKQTIDYFPHSCTHGKTIFILESQYGNDGYSFWFKLLEILGNSEGHFVNYNGSENSDWEYLKARVKLSDEKCIEILNLLSKLGAIDIELWKEKTVWSQNFIDGISDVYKKRKVEIPAKPSFGNPKPQTTDVSVTETLQSKVKEIKEKKKKVNKSKVKEIIYPFNSEKFMEKWNLWKEYRIENRWGKYKPIGEQAALSNLKNLSNDNENIAVEIIKNSIDNGWKGFFEIKNNYGKPTKRNHQTGSVATYEEHKKEKFSDFQRT